MWISYFWYYFVEIKVKTSLFPKHQKKSSGEMNNSFWQYFQNFYQTNVQRLSHKFWASACSTASYRPIRYILVQSGSKRVERACNKLSMMNSIRDVACCVKSRLSTTVTIFKRKKGLMVYYTMAVESMRLPNAKFAARGEAKCRNCMR